MIIPHSVDVLASEKYSRNASAFEEQAEKKDAVYFALRPSSTGSVIIMVLPPSRTESLTATMDIREYSEDYVELLNKAAWTKEFFEKASGLNDVRSLLPYYKEINTLLVKKEFDLCDTFLKHVRTKILSDTLLVGLLRLTSTWRSELPSWSLLLDRSKQELQDRGHDSEGLLKGLS